MGGATTGAWGGSHALPLFQMLVFLLFWLPPTLKCIGPPTFKFVVPPLLLHKPYVYDQLSVIVFLQS